MLFDVKKKKYFDLYLTKRYKCKPAKYIAAIDLDGTFLSNSRTIPEWSIKALALLRKHNIEPVICTQRHSLMVIKRFAKKLLQEGVRYYVFNNGATIYDHKEKRNLSVYYLHYDDLAELFNYCFMNRIQVVSYTNHGIFANKNANIARKIFSYYSEFIHSYADIHQYQKLHIYRFYIPFSLNIFHREPPREIHWKYPNHFLVTSMFHGYSFNAVPISKGTGLKKICQILQCQQSNTVGFGDGPNDVSLAKACGFFIAMPISSPELVKCASKQISGSREVRFYNAVKYFLHIKKDVLFQQNNSSISL